MHGASARPLSSREPARAGTGPGSQSLAPASTPRERGRPEPRRRTLSAMTSAPPSSTSSLVVGSFTTAAVRPTPEDPLPARGPGQHRVTRVLKRACRQHALHAGQVVRCQGQEVCVQWAGVPCATLRRAGLTGGVDGAGRDVRHIPHQLRLGHTWRCAAGTAAVSTEHRAGRPNGSSACCATDQLDPALLRCQMQQPFAPCKPSALQTLLCPSLPAFLSLLPSS